MKSSNAKERSYRDLDPNATIFILTDNVNRATPKNYQGQASSFDKDYEGQDASFDKIDRTPYSTFMDSLVNFLSSEKPSIAIRTASSAKSKLGSSRGSSLARVIDRVESKTPVLCLDLRERQMEIRDGIYDKRMMALIRDRYSLTELAGDEVNAATFNFVEFDKLVRKLFKRTTVKFRPVAKPDQSIQTTSTSATAGTTDAADVTAFARSWSFTVTDKAEDKAYATLEIAETFKTYANADGQLEYCKLSHALHDPALHKLDLNLSKLALERRTDHVSSVKALIEAKHQSLLSIEEEGSQEGVSSQEFDKALDIFRKTPLNDTLDCCDLALLHEALHGEDLSSLGQAAKGQRDIVMLHEAIQKKKNEVGEVDVENGSQSSEFIPAYTRQTNQIAQPTPQMITKTAAWLSDLIFSNAFDLLGTPKQKADRLAELKKQADMGNEDDKNKKRIDLLVSVLGKAEKITDCEPHTILNGYPQATRRAPPDNLLPSTHCCSHAIFTASQSTNSTATKCTHTKPTHAHFSPRRTSTPSIFASPRKRQNSWSQSSSDSIVYRSPTRSRACCCYRARGASTTCACTLPSATSSCAR